MWNPRLMALAVLCSVVASWSSAALLPGTYIGSTKQRREGEPGYQLVCEVDWDGRLFFALLHPEVSLGDDSAMIGYEAEVRNSGTILAKAPRQWQLRATPGETNITGRLTVYAGLGRHAVTAKSFDLHFIPRSAAGDRTYTVVTRTGSLTGVSYVSIWARPSRPEGGFTPRPPMVPVPGNYSGSGSVIVTGNLILSREDAEARIEAMRQLAGTNTTVLISPILVTPAVPSFTNVVLRPIVTSVPEPILVSPPSSSSGAVSMQLHPSTADSNEMEEVLLRRVVLTREMLTVPAPEWAP